MVRVFNVTGAPVYSGYLHRDVRSGEGFSVRLPVFLADRRARQWIGSRFMAYGDSGEESPYLSPRDAVESALEALRPQVAEAMEAPAPADPELAARLFASVADTVRPKPVAVKSEERVTEAPVTAGDVIGDEGPLSLEAIRRHNRAIRKFG